MHLQNKRRSTGKRGRDKGTSNVSKETSSGTAPSGSLPHSRDKEQPRNQGSRLTAGTDYLPFVAQSRSQPGLQPRLWSSGSLLHFSLPLRSGPRAPQTGLLPYSPPQPAERQSPALVCAFRPGPADPSTPAAASPGSDTGSRLRIAAPGNAGSWQ